MSNQTYRESLDAAVEELRDSIAKRDGLEHQLEEENDHITKLQDGVRGLSALCDIDYQTEYSELFPPGVDLTQGITEQVRSIFTEHRGRHFSAVDIRNRLKESGLSIHKYSNPLATIHTVLRRLYKADEIKSEDRDRKTYYYCEDEDEAF